MGVIIDKFTSRNLMRNVNGMSKVIFWTRNQSIFESLVSKVKYNFSERNVRFGHIISMDTLNFNALSITAPTLMVNRMNKLINSSVATKDTVYLSWDRNLQIIDRFLVESFNRLRRFGIISDAVNSRNKRVRLSSKEPGDILITELFDTLGISHMHDIGITGKGIDVAVIDTGVDVFNPMAGPNIQFSEIRRGEAEVGVDTSGHGTFTTTTIGGSKVELDDNMYLMGMAPESNVLSIKSLYTPMGTGSNSDILKAMEMAYDYGVDVISMSLGGSAETDYENDPLVAFTNEIVKRGVIVCAASGNDGTTMSVNTPGVAGGAIAVASTMFNDKTTVSDFSSRGPLPDGTIKPDISAFGGNGGTNDKPVEKIVCASSGMLARVETGASLGLGKLMGTSMSTPQVGAVMALWKQYAKDRYGDSQRMTYRTVLSLFNKFGHRKNSDDGFGLIDARWIEKI